MSADLLNALKSLGFGGETAEEQIGWRGVYPAPSTNDHFICEFCHAEHLDCAAIEHAPHCPVTIARAAVAEAERQL